jgi:hypothetical protein
MVGSFLRKQTHQTCFRSGFNKRMQSSTNYDSMVQHHVQNLQRSCEGNASVKSKRAHAPRANPRAFDNFQKYATNSRGRG